MQVDKAEALRYLGYKRGQTPDSATESVFNACIPALERAAGFLNIDRRFPVIREGDGIFIAGLNLQSRALSRHLEGCEEAYLFAATLGAGVDRLMQVYERTDLPAAVVLQACAAALLESCCDEAQDSIAAALAPGLGLRPRFSPGYGDLSLTIQPGILRVLDAQKRIGLFCTAHDMLTPTKSITAVIGVRPGCADKKRGCETCGMKDCTYRKE